MKEKAFLEKVEQFSHSQVQAWNNRQSLITQIPAIVVLPYDEFDKKYGASLYLDNSFDVLVFDGNLTIANATLNADWLNNEFKKTGNENDHQAMFVNGNLHISGDIVDDDYLHLQVAKNVYCHYLYSENGNIVIKGNLTALQGISGEYNDGMLQVFGKTATPYIVSNDHSMPDHSVIEHICIQNGKIGQSYDGGLEGWDFFEHSELMFKDGIYQDEYEINISAFFELVKKGENPFVDFATFKENLANLPNDEEDDCVGNDNQNEDETLEELLYLPDCGRSDDELYLFVIDKYDEIQKTTDESQKYGQSFFELSIVLGAMVSHWNLVSERYAIDKQENIRIICITLGNDWGQYLLKNSKDTKLLKFAYDFLQEAVEIEQNEPFIYKTIVRLGLVLQKLEDTYPLVRAISKNMPDVAKDINDVIESKDYQAWLATL